MARDTTSPIPNKARLRLYIGLVLGSGILGVALGYYLQILGRLSMSPYLIFAFTIRGMIVGAIVWAFELFIVLGPKGNRLAGLTPTARFAARIAVYLILGEAGFWIGEAIFEPEDIVDLFHTANGPAPH